MNNAVWSVSGQDTEPVWALRQHRAGWRSREAVAAELELLIHLGDRLPELICVPRPAASQSPDRLVELDGDLYSLLSWVDGSPRRPGSGLTDTNAWALGNALGSIHTATTGLTQSGMPVAWTASMLFTDHPGLMGESPTTLRRLLTPSDRALYDEVALRTAEVFADATDWGVIHADYILGNCNWSVVEERTQLGVLDFDDFGWGPRIFDLGAVLGNLADFPEDWPRMAPQFLDGYRAAHQLPDDAEQHLPLMMAARHTSQCLWTIGHREQGDEWITTHLRGRMKMAHDCLNIIL